MAINEAPGACIQRAHKGSKGSPVTKQHVTDSLKEIALNELYISAIGQTIPVSVLNYSVSLGEELRLRVKLEILPDEDRLALGGSDQEPCIQVGGLSDLDAQRAALKNRLREAYARYWQASQHDSQTQKQELPQEGHEQPPLRANQPSMEIQEEARPLSQGPVITARFQIEPVTEKNKSEVLGVLQEWDLFARQRFLDIEQAFKESRKQRDQLVDWDFSSKQARRLDHYYDKEQLDFRKQHKAKSSKKKNMDGALNEIKELLEGIHKLSGEALAKKFRIARGPGGIGGVMEGTSGRNTFIANLATHPMNIDPPPNYKPVAGAAQALIGSMISGNVLDQQGGFEDMSLFALNNLVKQIYDYFGFRVITDEEDTARSKARRGEALPQLPSRLERPPHPKTELKTAPNTKTDWHTLKNMMMAEPQAKAFLKKVAIDQHLIEVPPEVREWISK